LKKVLTGLTLLSLLPTTAAYAVDGVGPSVASFSSSPTSIDLRNGEGLVSVSGRVQDVSGVDHIHFHCRVTGESSRWLAIAISFSASFPEGFVAGALGSAGYTTSIISTKEISGGPTDFSFSVSMRIPSEANSTNCQWRYFAADELGNRISQSQAEGLGHFLEVIDNAGGRFSSPSVSTPTPTPTQTTDPDSSLPTPGSQPNSSISYTLKWQGQQATLITAGLSNGDVVQLQVGTKLLRRVITDGKTTFPLGNLKPGRVVSLVGPDGVLKTLRLNVKFKNCKTLRATFKGGIAKSNSAVVKSTNSVTPPTLFKSAYVLNKKFDKDKDGVSCEKN
jgi:hypothetical protein